MGDIGFPELILIGVVLIVFFGPKKLPEFGASIGKAIKDFRRAMKDTTSDVEEALKESKPDEVESSEESHDATQLTSTHS